MCCIVDRSEPLMLPGTVSTFRRRCGKPTCRCAAGDPHESPALVFTEDGRTKTVTLSEAEVAEVEAAVARYRAAQAELEQQAVAGVAAFRARRAQRRSSRASR
jgi:hypothetical protein